MSVIRSFRLSLFLAFAAGCDAPQEPPAGSAASTFSARVDALLPALLQESETPGAAIAVIEQGELTLVSGYGFADTGAMEPMTPEHVFNAASISKAMTAWGVMRLVDQGRVDLDAPVNRYLQRWQLADSRYGTAAEVSVRRLLSHTAGISMPSTPGFRLPADVPSLVSVLDGDYENSTYAQAGTAVAIRYPPGGEFSYSGGGYLILQLLIEDLTGQSFPDYMREHVLDPLGMTESQFGWDPEVSRGMATPYTRRGSEEDIFRLPGHAASSLHTSARDIAKWLMAGAWTNTALRNQVLTDASYAAMLTPVVENTSNARELTSMGLGYFVETVGEETAAGHSGGNAGWRARILLSPDRGSGFAVLTNGDAGDEVAAALSCLWAASPQGVAISADC